MSSCDWVRQRNLPGVTCQVCFLWLHLLKSFPLPSVGNCKDLSPVSLLATHKEHGDQGISLMIHGNYMGVNTMFASSSIIGFLVACKILLHAGFCTQASSSWGPFSEVCWIFLSLCAQRCLWDSAKRVSLSEAWLWLGESPRSPSLQLLCCACGEMEAQKPG